MNQSMTCKINLNITLKKDLPANETLYITGNLPELGDWDPAGRPLAANADGRYSLAFEARKGSIVECKLTRGSWKTQGIYDLQDIPPSNLIIKARQNRRVNVEILDWLDQQVLESDPVMGKLVDSPEFPCKGLKHKRAVQVWLPESYSKFSEPAAVIYMHDGQNLFEPFSAFAGVDWKVDETISAMLQEEELRPCIVVGIPNSPDRMQELNLFTGPGKAYAEMVIKEIMPWVNSHFNVSHKAEDTMIMGSSMGGLMSFQMISSFNQHFGLAGCLSSAFQKAGNRIFQQTEKSCQLPDYARIYLDTGEYEPPIADSYLQMMTLLKSRGMIEGHNLMGLFDEEATHCEAAWARRLHIPLRFLLGKK
jgi:enterochelin esterase-like enzyme